MLRSFTPAWRRTLLGVLLSLVALPSTAATLRIHYNTGYGNNISIRGSAASLSWTTSKAATWTTGNVWVYTTPVSDGGFEFKPMYNGTTWSKGANYVVPDGNAVVDVYPYFFSTGGSVVTVNSFSSTILGNSRKLYIYRPPSYTESGAAAKRYPVVYMQDGRNLFNASTSFSGVEWKIDETLNSKIPGGTAREVIVVGIDNTSARISEYTPVPDPGYGGGNGNNYLNFIQNELMPWVNANYRTLTGPANTTIGGSSLGGLISFYAAWTRSNVFGSAIAMSSSFWWNGEWMLSQVQNYNGSKIPAVFYIDSGSDGAAETFDMRDLLVARGYVYDVDLHHYYNANHSHNEAAWQARFPIVVDRVLFWK